MMDGPEPQPGAAGGAQEAYYNPRPAPPQPVPRVEVEELRSFTGQVTVRERVVFGVEGASTLSSVGTLLNTAMGAGVLGLPYAFRCSGLAGCLVLYAVVALLEGFTMYVLAKFAERYGATSYGQLVRRALGRKSAAALSGLTVLYLWGSSVAYLVVVADTFTSLSAELLGPEAWASQRGPLLLVAGVLLLPACFPRNLSAMEYISGGAVVAFLYTVVAVSTRGVQEALARPDLWEGVRMFVPGLPGLRAVPIVVFSMNAHANVVGVFHELEHYPHTLVPGLPSSPTRYHSMGRLAPKPHTFKLIGMLGATCCFMAGLLVTYTAVGVTGYLAFPSTASSNILNSFAPGDAAIRVARAAIGCVCLASYPLNHHPARAAWEDLADSLADTRPLPGWLSALLTTAFVSTTVAVAVAAGDLGSVLHLVGGTAAACLVLLLPGLLLMNAATIKHAASVGAAGGGLAWMAAGSDHEEEGEGDEEGPPSAAAAGASAPLLRPAPRGPLPRLLSKKAGFRESGLLFVPGKSWWAGLALVVVSLLVMAVTLATTE